ncbi:hypothetical protein SS50377_26457 [Spironucleus salmonicida]|uniref:RING-type domain-containing protein n=1 Tax=Spironucleus salmonicida TaxID=348837 RepID=V6LAA5_9EUKA|nr:hypothetical protein SS50377_26457 [Spironucleus salmonicida]|eukprot:EST41317.1 hypothetical protein SS50377_19029 [Spironucleus salmonicida]
MPLTTQSTKSANLIKLMENYPISSPSRMSTPNMNVIQSDLLSEDLLRKIDDLTSKFHREDPTNTEFDLLTIQNNKFSALEAQSELFRKNNFNAPQVLKDFGEHVQRLTDIAQASIDTLDLQCAREQHELKLAYDMDVFRLQKILNDVQSENSKAQRALALANSPKIRLFTSLSAPQKIDFQLKIDRFQRDLSGRISGFAAALFELENDLKILDATQKQFLEISCQVCQNVLNKSQTPLVLSCGHGICSGCFSHFYHEPHDQKEFTNQECKICGVVIQGVVVDRVMLSRIQEGQLKMDDIIEDTLGMVQEGQMLVAQYGVI